MESDLERRPLLGDGDLRLLGGDDDESLVPEAALEPDDCPRSSWPLRSMPLSTSK